MVRLEKTCQNPFIIHPGSSADRVVAKSLARRWDALFLDKCFAIARIVDACFAVMRRFRELIDRSMGARDVTGWR